jgi:chromosome segregation ATPase
MEMTIILGAVVVIFTTIITTGKLVFDRLSKDIDRLREDIQRLEDRINKQLSDHRTETNMKLRDMDIPTPDLPADVSRRLSRTSLELSGLTQSMHYMRQQLVDMNNRMTATEQEKDAMNTKQKFLYTGLGVLIAIILLGLGYALGKNL